MQTPVSMLNVLNKKFGANNFVVESVRHGRDPGDHSSLVVEIARRRFHLYISFANAIKCEELTGGMKPFCGRSTPMSEWILAVAQGKVRNENGEMVEPLQKEKQ